MLPPTQEGPRKARLPTDTRDDLLDSDPEDFMRECLPGNTDADILASYIPNTGPCTPLLCKDCSGPKTLSSMEYRYLGSDLALATNHLPSTHRNTTSG